MFSSSSDLAVEKQTGQQSPLEEASVAEDANAEGTKDELETQQVCDFSMKCTLNPGMHVPLDN